MPAELYEILAQGASYWFAFLGVVIVWRSFAWLRKDGRLRRKRIRQLPDAGFIGEMVVISGSDQLRPGVLLPLPREGVLGSYRGCDVTVPVDGVAGKHLTFRFVPGKGLMIEPWVRQEVWVDGESVTHRGRPGRMYHGSRLQVGEAVLRMRLFIGVETDKMRCRRPVAEPVVELPEDWREQTQPHYQAIKDWENAGEDWQQEGWQQAPEAQMPYPQEMNESPWQGEPPWQEDPVWQEEPSWQEYQEPEAPVYEENPEQSEKSRRSEKTRRSLFRRS